jgi:hypothetical protein
MIPVTNVTKANDTGNKYNSKQRNDTGNKNAPFLFFLLLGVSYPTDNGSSNTASSLPIL